MFGFDFLTRRKKASTETPIVNRTAPENASSSSGVIMVSDFVGSLDPNEKYTEISIVSERGNIKVIRTDIMQKFISNTNAVQKIFRDAIIGKCDGMFPVTNPVKDNIYYYPVDNKYYKCITSHTGAVIKPDDKFKEFSLINMNDTKFKTINILGAAKGSGDVDERGVINVTTTVNYNDISGRPTSMKNPNSFVLQLNGKNQTAYDGSTAVSVNVTPQNIGAQPAGNYAASNHNHDDTYSKLDHTHSQYQPKGDYANRSHNHSVAAITNFSGYVKGTTAGAISESDNLITAIGKLEKGLEGKQNSGNYAPVSHTHDDRYFTETEITEKLKGYSLTTHNHSGVYQPVGNYSVEGHKHDDLYQPKGSYASSNHNHDSVYSKLNHEHTASNINMTGYVKGETSGAITVTDTLGTALGKIEVNLDGKQPKGNYAASNHNHDSVYAPKAHNHNDLYNTKAEITKMLENYSKNGHSHNSGNITSLSGYAKAETFTAITTGDSLNTAIGKLEKGLEGKQPAGSYAAANHNHDTAYAKLSHNHNDLYNTKAEITEKLTGYSLSSHKHDDLYQPKGNYANASHTHTSANISAMTGYAKASAVSAIAVTDSLNVAIGKLEKALDSKQASGSYAPANHDHNTLYYGKGEIDTKLGGYSPTTHNHDNSYAAKTHNHNDLYNTKTEVTNLLSGKLDKTANAVSASKLATARTVAVSGAVSGSATFDGSANVTINTSLNGFDAGKITSGVISVDRLPKTALSEFVAVANKEARLKLTKTQVQNGDTVKETDTKRMFLVVDDTKLNVEEGYQEYTTIVDWASITGKPSTFNPSTHTHTWEQITNRPTTMANPHGLTISLNGKAQTAYTGASAVAFNITAASIGAQVAGSYASSSHNHDTVYAKISHSHTEYQPKGSYAAANHNHDTVYAAKVHNHDDKYQPKGNYQPAGSYASSSHNHDSVYAKLSHTHSYLPLSGGSVTGVISSNYRNSTGAFAQQYGTKAPFYNEFTTTGTSEFIPVVKQKYTVSGKSGVWSAGTLINSNEFVIHHINLEGQETTYYKFDRYGNMWATDKKVWHAGNFDPNSKAASNHNHDTAYAAKSHSHNDLYNTKTEITNLLKGYSPTSHNHSGVYAPVSHTHSGYQPAGDYALKNHTHTGYLSINGGTLNGTLVTQKDGGIKYVSADGSDKWLIHNSYGREILLGYSTSNQNVPVKCFGELFAMGDKKVWHAGNLDLSNYSLKTHNHDLVYQPKGNYAALVHNHDTVYAAKSHIHENYALVQHAHDARYQPKGDYAASSHTHTASQVTGLPTALKNPTSLSIQLNGGTATSYDGSAAKSINITAASIGAQVAGSYAAASHTHPYLSTSGGTVSGALTVTGQILSNADVVAYSDKRFKTNIKLIDNPLEKINKINGYYYDMMGVENEHQVGVIAQELQEVLPEAVFEDKNGHLGVRYTNIVPVLVEAVKSLNDDNNKLHQENKELKDEVISLKDRLDRLERILLKKGV